LGSGIASEVLLRAVLWIGAGVMAVSIGLLAAVALARLGLVRRLARERIFVTRWEPLLVECVAAVPADVPVLAPRDVVLFLRLWSRMHEAVRGAAQAHLNALARRVGADRVAAGYLGSRNLRKRLIAVLALGQLRASAVQAELESLLADPRPALSLAAAQALLRIDGAGTLRRVLAAASEREDWAPAKLASMLQEADPAQVSAALAGALDGALSDAGAEVQVARLLKLAPTAHGEVLRPAVLRVFERARDPETLAAALATIQHPDDVGLARRHASHADAVVRLHAVKALARLGVHEDVDRLVALLSDPSWWVRYRSAQTLVASPWLSRGELERLRAALTDRFAVDMLGQALAEAQ
jgi:HEAT repeat protein